MNSRYKVVFAGMIGNALEFYDFSLYGFFATILASQFFPAGDRVAAIFYTFTVFGVGFLMRPLGAVVFGHIGDKYGRKIALSLSVILMAVPTALIGVLPNYATIGILAPIVLTFCRLLQGLCTGGEYNGAAIFVIEHQKDKRGFAGGLITSSCAIGSLLGTLVGWFFSGYSKCFGIDAWRIPFIMGIIIGIIGLYTRHKLDESPEFQEAVARKKASGESTQDAPLLTALRKHLRSVICIIGIAWLNGVMYYSTFTYISVYLHNVFGWSLQSSLPMASLALLAYAVMTPLVGALSDRVGEMRLMRPAALLIALTAVPLYIMIGTANLGLVVVAQLIYALLAALFSGPINVLMQSLFPVEDRYSGIAFSYSVGMAIFGGFTPLIMESLLHYTGMNISPSFWLTVSGIGATFVLYVLCPKIKVNK